MGSLWCGNYGAYALFDVGHIFMIFVIPKLGEEPEFIFSRITKHRTIFLRIHYPSVRHFKEISSVTRRTWTVEIPIEIF